MYSPHYTVYLPLLFDFKSLLLFLVFFRNNHRDSFPVISLIIFQVGGKEFQLEPLAHLFIVIPFVFGLVDVVVEVVVSDMESQVSIYVKINFPTTAHFLESFEEPTPPHRFSPPCETCTTRGTFVGNKRTN